MFGTKLKNNEKEDKQFKPPSTPENVENILSCNYEKLKNPGSG